MGGQLLSDDFTAGLKPTTWTVVDEGTTAKPSKWYVPPASRLRQESKISGMTSDPLAQPGTYLLAGQSDWRDYSFTAKMKANNLDADPGAMGIMFGYRDAKNYYRFSMHRKASAWRLVKVVNGMVTLLASDNVRYDLSRFYTVEAKMAKGKIEIWVDFQRVFAVSDVSHNSGKVAIYASAHAGLAVDYVLVSELDAYRILQLFHHAVSSQLWVQPQARVQWTSRLPAGAVGRRVPTLPGLPLPVVHRGPAMGWWPTLWPRIRRQRPARAR